MIHEQEERDIPGRALLVIGPANILANVHHMNY